MKPEREENLIPPKIYSPEEKGIILRVVGIFERGNEIWINTATEDNKLVNYRLPSGLIPWGKNSLSMVDLGFIPFPCNIEFGNYGGHVYAEIL